MTSPLSVGDVFLIGKLALKLGRAFTKGRKSAPAEFREVESQLYSLNIALTALDRLRLEQNAKTSGDEFCAHGKSPSSASGAEDSLGTMLKSCEETLQHLEIIVRKYGDIIKPLDPEKPVLKRWNRYLRDNWKKVAWTTEGGDLATLRSHLSVHKNSLNLVLGVMLSSQTSRIGERVEAVSTMLSEIHKWFVENLKESVLSTQAVVEARQAKDLASEIMTFQVYLEADQVRTLLCNHASLHAKWNEKLPGGVAGTITASEHLLTCCCVSSAQGNGIPSHQEQLGVYGLSPLSFPVRLTGKVRTWMLYKVTEKTTNRLVSLIIKNVPLRNMAEFEETFVKRLGTTSAGAMLSRGLSTILAHFSPEAQEWRILHLTGETNGIQKTADTITFSTGHRSYSRNSIEAIKLLHYRALSDRGAQTDPSREFRYLDSAEIVIYFDEQQSKADADITSTNLYLRHDTEVKLDTTEGNVLLRQLTCTGLDPNESTNTATGVDVKFQFATSAAAEQFGKKIEEMKMELFVISLQFPRKNEELILKLQASEVQSEEIHISDAEISIVRDKTKEIYRLIIVSRNGCSVLSQELTEEFFSSLKIPGQRPRFTSPTYCVQIKSPGTREVYVYPNGLKYLDFSSVQNERLFELGLATITGALSISN